jgi:hypothetical protein
MGLETVRLFRMVNVPRQIFSNCIICLNLMEVILTTQTVFIEEDDRFNALIEGYQVSPSGQIVILLRIHGWRDKYFHGGFWPTTKTTRLTIRTTEIIQGISHPNSTEAQNLNKEFNKRFNLYVWHISG